MINDAAIIMHFRVAAGFFCHLLYHHSRCRRPSVISPAPSDFLRMAERGPCVWNSRTTPIAKMAKEKDRQLSASLFAYRTQHFSVIYGNQELSIGA